MKRIVIIILAIFLVISLSACTVPSREQAIGAPVFYYLSSRVHYGSETGLICPELRQEAQNSDTISALKVYLTGPVSDQLTSPFPSGTALLDYHQSDDHVVITVSNHIQDLSGIDLCVACACLAKTVLSMTAVDSVRINAGDPEEQTQSFIFTRQNLLLVDLE